MKTRVLLDTNALLLFGQEHLDLFSGIADVMKEPYELVVLDHVLAELTALTKKKTRDGQAARLGLVLVRQKENETKAGILDALLVAKKRIPLKIIPGSKEKHADDAIVAIAEDDKERSVVCTLDKGLQRRLLKKGIRVLGVRQRQIAYMQ
jgi:rRNA-processing protein FCF1